MTSTSTSTVHKCTKCDEICEVISIEDYDIEEFWGAPCRRYYSEDASECCQAEVYEDDDPTPYCNACGAMTKSHCECGPIAENE